jgi:hypothetical protein
MDEIIEALASHENWESQPVEVRLPGGAWADMKDLLAPIIKAWQEIGTIANSDALDGDDVAKLDPNSYIVGRSDMAHRVLQIMARAEQEIKDR